MQKKILVIIAICCMMTGCDGKEVSATELLGESDEQVLEKVCNLMGMYEVTDWEDIDFYLQKDKIVFFYRMPGYWEDVVLGR